MEIFHYCAERLQEIPLFTSCSDESIFANKDEPQQGSIYNDFDFNPASFIENEDFAGFEDSQSQSTSNQNEGDSELVQVSQATIDEIFLQADNDDHSRWSFESDLFDCTSNINSEQYMKKVYDVARYEWDYLDIYDDHIRRWATSLWLIHFVICPLKEKR